MGGPEPGHPQALNRYACVLNSPLRYTDPSGHWVETAWDILNIAWDIYEVYRDPHSWENWVALAVDVGAAVLPAVPAGAGLVVRGGKVARAAVKAASHGDELADAARALSDLGEGRRVTTRAVGGAAQAFVQRVAREAEERVSREGWLGNIELARHLAQTQQPEILPGLFQYNPSTDWAIKNYQQHHLWPLALGGPKEGWTVYVRNYHTAGGGIQDRLNQFLRARLNMTQRKVEEWARQNPDKILPLLREFYERERVNFPY